MHQKFENRLLEVCRDLMPYEPRLRQYGNDNERMFALEYGDGVLPIADLFDYISYEIHEIPVIADLSLNKHNVWVASESAWTAITSFQSNVFKALMLGVKSQNLDNVSFFLSRCPGTAVGFDIECQYLDSSNHLISYSVSARSYLLFFDPLRPVITDKGLQKFDLSTHENFFRNACDIIWTMTSGNSSQTSQLH